MTSPLHCPPLLVALALAWPLGTMAQVAPPAPTMLTPPTQRITDAAIDADHQAYERLQATTSAWTQHKAEQIEVTREMLIELREEIRFAMRSLKVHGFEQAQAA